MRLGPFQTQIPKCKTMPLLGETTDVMIAPLKAGVVQPAGAHPLPPGLHMLHMYTRLKMGSNKVSVIMHNMSDSPIFLKKVVQVAHIVSVLPVPSAKLLPEMDATLGEEAWPEPISVAAHQEKLLEKLNLDGLSNWTPQSTAVTRELVLAFHNIFTLDGNELSCMSAIELEIHISDGEPFKERFGCIPPPLLEEVCTSLRDMLEVEAIHPSQSPWCNTVVLVHKKDLCRFPPAQHMHQGFIPTAKNTGSTGKHGGHHTFLNNGF